MMKKLLLLSFIFINLITAEAEVKVESVTEERTFLEKVAFKPQKPLTEDELMDRVIYTNIVFTGGVLLWGTAFWDYFSTAPVLGNEGWFGKNTKHGGADKLGHMYSTYLWSLGFSSLFEYWGMQEDQSSLYGPLTAWIFQGMMEVGDSFSTSQGFSYEDMIMNTIGAGFYYVREKYPAVKEKLDLRLEYIPDPKSDKDLFTQYNSMKYLMALKFSGFESMKDSPMKYFELQLGYYTRGYQEREDYTQKERIVYVGIGINASEILKALGWTKTSKIFNYYQLPYTYVPFGYDFDVPEYVAPYSRPYRGYKR